MKKQKANSTAKKWVTIFLIPLASVVLLFSMQQEANRRSPGGSLITSLERMEKPAWADQTSTHQHAPTREENYSGKENSDKMERSEKTAVSSQMATLEKVQQRQMELQSHLIQEKLKRLEEVRSQLDSDLAERRKQDSERIQKLVQVVEKMRPQAAAQFMESVSNELAIEILERLSIEKGSKIFNLIKRESLARIGERFVGMEAENSRNPEDRSPASEKSTKSE